MTSYSLGVDLGTTFTAAATVDETGVPTMVGLGNRAMQIPSVVHLGPDGATLVGELAERQAVADPTSVAREFKRRMGDTVPIYVGKQPITAEVLNGTLLRWVIDRTTERMGGPPSHVTLTHPATWTSHKVGKLAKAAELAGVPEFALCSEPVAAATHYAVNHTVEIGDRICIYDLGGGTFDVCVVVKTVDGFEILGTPDGVDELGGVDFDKQITTAVSHSIASVHAGFDEDDPGFARLRRECVDAKEALSDDVDTVIPVALEGFSTSYRFTRGEFESMIDAAIDLTITATQNALKSAGVSSSDLSVIVLVGGSSRIPLVSERLARSFRCRLAVNTHPKHEVALGAAMAGAPKESVDLPDNPPTPQPRGHWRPRKALVGVSGLAAAAVLAVLVLGRSWLLPSASAQSTDPVGPPTAAVVNTPGTTTALDPGPSSADQPTSTADEPNTTELTTTSRSKPTDPPVTTGSPMPTSPPESTAVPPVSLDEDSVTWLRTLCGGGSQIDDAKIVPGASYPSIRAAHQAYVDSYRERAVIAHATADALELTETSTIAGGRIDPEDAIDGLRRLADILDDGGQVIAEAEVGTVAELIAADTAATAQIRQSYQPADLQLLSEEELAFVATMPGCESIGG